MYFKIELFACGNE